MSRIVQFPEFGEASILEVVEVEPATPGPGKVRVAMRAAGINPADSKVRGGQGMGSKPQVFPGRLGREVAGVIESLGDGVTEFALGDEVFGIVASVGLADLVVTNPANLARRPRDLPWEVAGGLPLIALTAWDSVASQHLTDADTVLVSAAAGGVGNLAAQLALRAGATVIGTASESNHDHLRSLGIIPISYGPQLAERVRAMAPHPVTVVLDHHGAETIEAGLELGVDPARINTIAADPAIWGVVHVGRGPINTETLETVAAMVISGELQVTVTATYPLAEVVAAFERLDDGHVRGKIVIVP